MTKFKLLFTAFAIVLFSSAMEVHASSRVERPHGPDAIGRSYLVKYIVLVGLQGSFPDTHLSPEGLCKLGADALIGFGMLKEKSYREINELIHDDTLSTEESLPYLLKELQKLQEKCMDK